MIQVLVADDEAMVRRGLVMLLKLAPDIHIVGEANDGLEALELVQTYKPDVVIMDVSMPRLDGVQATAALRELAPATAVVILTLHGDPATRARAIAAGAAGFVVKGDAENSLIVAIRQAALQAQNNSNCAVGGNCDVGEVGVE